MLSHGIEATILDIQYRNSDIVFRLDKNGVVSDSFAPKSIRTLTLNNCEDVAGVSRKLQHAIGQSLYYKLMHHPESVTVLLSIEYGVADLEVRCAAVSEVESDYTFEDLQQKYRWLTEMCVASDAHYERLSQQYDTLTTRLEAELQKELDRCQRKTAFFQTAYPEKVAVAKAQAEVYAHVLKLLARLQKEG